MYLMLSWILGERPYLDFLPTNNVVALLKAILVATQAGREVEIYWAEGDTLQLVYPDAESVLVASAGLMPKPEPGA